MNLELPSPLKPSNRYIAPWNILTCVVEGRLYVLQKHLTPPVIYRKLCLEIKASYPDHTFIYTDGSAIGDSVACAFYCNLATRSFKITGFASVSTAENMLSWKH